MLHAALALAITVVGRQRLLPSQFSESGIGSFAYDGFLYQTEVTRLAGLLKTEGVAAWAATPSELHLKLYSLSYALVWPSADFNVLTVEPINLIAYLLVIALVYEIGRYVFDRRAGLLAASVVALWPSLLLHTAQLLKDSFFIVALLATLFAAMRLIGDDGTWRKRLSLLSCIALAAASGWIIRMASWEVARFVILMTIVGLLVRQWHHRRPWHKVVIEVVALAAIIFLIPHAKGPAKFLQYSVRQGEKAIARKAQGHPLWEVIAIRRRGFATTTVGDDGATVGSNIDTDTEFSSPADILLYLPRAFEIGFWAPFPDAWFSAGRRVGSAGRLLAGAETLIMYLCELLALVAVLRAPRCLPVWLLLLVSTLGMTALGLILSNVGALYRLRYVFWILLIILGAKGFESVVAALRGETSVPLDGRGGLKEAA